MRKRGPKSRASRVIVFDELSNDAYITVTEAIKLSVTPGGRATTYRAMKAQKYPAPRKFGKSPGRLKVGDIRSWSKDPAEYFHIANEIAVRGKKS
jgi:hypothetical protein